MRDRDFEFGMWRFDWWESEFQLAEALGKNLRSGMRGRMSLADQYPSQMIECKAQLVQHFEEARSRKPPCTPDQNTLFNTWNSIVKQYNRSQQIIGQPPLKSRRKDGMFSVSCVRNICRDVHLEATWGRFQGTEGC